MEPHSDTNGPVTVVISRRVIPGKESEFEQLSADMTLAASHFEGYLGTNLFRPASSEDPEYRIIFRFASHAALNVWEASEQRAQLLGSIEALLSSPTQRERTYGIANWFDLPGHPAANQQSPPAKYKMTIVSWMALYPIVTLIFFLFGEPLAHIPLLLRTLLVTAAVMVLMSYVAMPRMTRWFGFWLFPKRQP